MTCTTLSELQTEKASLLAAQQTLTSIQAGWATSGKSASVQEFTIGRTTVKFRSALDVAQAIAENTKSLRIVRQQIQALKRNGVNVMRHDRYNGVTQ